MADIPNRVTQSMGYRNLQCQQVLVEEGRKQEVQEWVKYLFVLGKKVLFFLCKSTDYKKKYFKVQSITAEAAENWP